MVAALQQCPLHPWDSETLGHSCCASLVMVRIWQVSWWSQANPLPVFFPKEPGSMLEGRYSPSLLAQGGRTAQHPNLENYCAAPWCAHPILSHTIPDCPSLPDPGSRVMSPCLHSVPSRPWGPLPSPLPLGLTGLRVTLDTQLMTVTVTEKILWAMSS